MGNVRETYTFVDLFAGAGGFSLGFSRSRFICVGVVENDPIAAKTYATNFPEHAAGPLALLGPNDGNVLRYSRSRLETLLSGVDDEIDVLLAGPPCQGFSRVGRGKLDSLARRKGAFKHDPRNRLYRKFIDFLEILRPRIFLFENVPGILHLKGENLADAVCIDATRAGYKVACSVLNAAWYGVPQNRERVFVVGVRADLGIEPSFPMPKYRVELKPGHLSSKDLSHGLFSDGRVFCRVRNPESSPPAITVHDAIRDLPVFTEHLHDRSYRITRDSFGSQPYRSGRPNSYAALMRNWGKGFNSLDVSDHFSRSTPRDYRIFSRMKPGERYPEAVKIAKSIYRHELQRYERGARSKKPKKSDFVPPYKTTHFDEKWRKLIQDEPSWTVTAHLEKDCYSHIHYDKGQKRTITIREAARLQSFPDAFVFAGNIGDCFRQIGNAVPPLMAFEMARHVKRLLNRAERIGDGK